MAYLPLSWAIVYHLLLSAVGVAMMLWDRYWAVNRIRKWINELLLLFVALLGGAPAMMTVMLVTRHKLRKPKFYISLPLMTLLHIALLVVIASYGPRFTFCVDIDIMYVVIYVAAVSVVALVLTFIDKNLARTNSDYRLAEDTLMLWAGLGGAVAMLAAMISIRHKTKHVKFMLGLPIMILIQAGIFYWFWEYSTLVMFRY